MCIKQIWLVSLPVSNCFSKISRATIPGLSRSCFGLTTNNKIVIRTETVSTPKIERPDEEQKRSKG